jgi:hypothetical protein
VVAGSAYLGAGLPGFGTFLNSIESCFVGASGTFLGAIGNAAGATLDVGHSFGKAGVTIGKPFYFTGCNLYSLTSDIGILGSKLAGTIPEFINVGATATQACGDFIKKHPHALATVISGVIGYKYIYKPLCGWWDENSWWGKPKEKKDDKKIIISY